jgi:hypothetical protein
VKIAAAIEGRTVKDTPSIAIEWERDGQMTVRPFCTQTNYATKAEADTHGLIHGMRIIDGQVPGSSVD